MPGKSFRLALPVRITETAGLRAAVNFARLQLLLLGVEVERAELGADAFIAALGTNRVEANGSLAGNLNFDFNSSDFDSRNLTVNLTDDRQNVHNLVVGTITLEVILFCTLVTNDGEGETIRLRKL